MIAARSEAPTGAVRVTAYAVPSMTHPDSGVGLQHEHLHLEVVFDVVGAHQ